MEDVLHILVNQKVLKGYRNEAMNHSKETHQIPVELGEGESNYSVIFENLCKFMERDRQNNRLPPLYTVWAIDDIYYPAKSILGKLASASSE